VWRVSSTPIRLHGVARSCAQGPPFFTFTLPISHFHHAGTPLLTGNSVPVIPENVAKSINSQLDTHKLEVNLTSHV
jgi:hypothetical protein